MKPYKPMWPATAWTYATAPYRLLVMICYSLGVLIYEARHFLKWQAVGLVLWLCVILMNWTLYRGIDLSLLNPFEYSWVGWFMFVGSCMFWVWMWVNE